LSYYSALGDLEDAHRHALGDLEDAHRQAKVQREFQRWQQRESDSWSGDTTAPGEVDIAELEQIREKGMAARVQTRRDLRNRARAVEEARRLARIDREYEAGLR